jgi:hypothetical protein
MFYEPGNEHIRIIDDALQTSDIPVGSGQVIGASVDESGVTAIIIWTGGKSGPALLYDTGK